MTEKYTNGINFLESLMTNNNVVRNGAEKHLNELKQSNPEQLFSYCMEGLNFHTKNSVVQMALFIIKSHFVKNKIEILTKFKDQLMNSILNVIKTYETRVLMNIAAEILCGIASNTNSAKFLFQELANICLLDDSKLKMFALITFDTMATYLNKEAIDANIESVFSFISTLYKDSDLRMKTQAIKTMVSYLSSIESAELLGRMKGILNEFVEIMIEVLKYDEEEGKKILESLINLTENQPDIWDNNLPGIILICSRIITTTSLEKETRSEAIELVLSIANYKKMEIRNLDELKVSFLPAFLQLIAEVKDEDDIEAWVKDDGDDELETSSVLSLTIYHLCTVLGSEIVLALIDSHIVPYLRSTDWRQRQAGLLCIALISENCKPLVIIEPTLRNLLRLIFPFIGDEHVRVRFAATTSLALICTQLSPAIQNNYYKETLSFIWKAIDDSNIKLKSQGVSCLVNFLQEVTNKEILKEYLDPLMEKLMMLFEFSLTQNYRPLQSEILSCICVICKTTQEKFVKYYNQLIPGFKILLANTPMNTIQFKELRANIIKTVGSILCAVADVTEIKEQIFKDTKEFIAAFLTILSMRLTNDDPQPSVIYRFWGEASFVLCESFVEYLPTLLPPLFEYMKLDTKLVAIDTQNPAASDPKLNVVLKIGATNISIDTHAFKLKTMASNVLLEICNNTKKGFKPYTEVMTKVVLDLLNNTTSGILKRNSAKFFKVLLMTCNNKEEMVKLFNFIYPHFIDSMLREIEGDMYKSLRCHLKELYKALVLFVNGPQVLTEANANILCKILAKVFNCYAKLYQKKSEELKNGDDPDIISDANNELSKEGNLIIYAGKISGVIAKMYKAQCESSFISILIPKFAEVLKVFHNFPKMQAAAIKFFSNCIENFHSEQFKTMIGTELGTKLIGLTCATNQKILKAVFYSLGTMAEHLPKQFEPLVPSAITSLLGVIQEHDARSSEKVQITEKAIGALGRIIIFHCSDKSAKVSLVQQFLLMIPIRENYKEAQRTHRLLLEQAAKGNSALNSNKAELKSALERILQTHTKEPELEIITPEDVPMLNHCINILNCTN